jgi:glycosyltransferase involved in cell wall biosynthesis
MEPLSLPGNTSSTPAGPEDTAARPAAVTRDGQVRAGTSTLPSGLVELGPETKSRRSSGQAEAASARPRKGEPASSQPARSPLALFCYEPPEGPLGQYVSKLVDALSRRGTPVHLFTRLPFPIDCTGVKVHVVGPAKVTDPLDSVEDFALQCSEVFGKQFPNNASAPALVGLEWTSISALQLLREHTDRDYVLSLGSLERQRSDMTSELSKRIDEIEMMGLRDAPIILAQDQAVSEGVRLRVPECSGRVVSAVKPFPMERFTGVDDPGKIKARYQIGPVDPTVLFIGDLDERHGPDVLMKAVPAILKNHPQARFAFVGDGDLLWPLRVYARYLMLEGVVRMVGHVDGQALYELIQAADILAVPSREATEWWPFQAAWAARRPVVATHTMGCKLLEHERNTVLIYPHESSMVWGVERILYDQDLSEVLVQNGAECLEERFGWNSVAAQLEELLASKQPA